MERVLWGLLFWGIGSQFAIAETPVPDANRAYQYLKDVCDIGPRISGTEGMLRQQKMIADHFTKFSAEVRYQEFDVTHPQTGAPVRMKNMIVSWHPDRTERVLVCCHYDTRPFPDQEATAANRAKPFIGANDGGSGVALLMEFAHHMKSINPKLGVDFVFFDGEELVYSKGDKYFHGSEYFATQYRDNPPENFRYVKGVLLDMVADRNLNIYIEKNSYKYAPEVTRSIWETARKLGVREFINRQKYEIRDDHIPLNLIAKIPTCDIIDFDYPYWHKRNDLPAACSGKSMAKVGRVVLAWLDEN
ncbi:M28 family peptidase [Thalassoglobus polymorphus]|uniref:Succinyl-diaminopimelate desuccinylase n=1 Tax=Thalassoglobus polymorphus TaxID=2527994 RepID=A0A517QIW8_9PLAN|nr:M28 family peptidase [Thalassoglobus polymorphus]QDT31600.1 succinyl-diaminopimelate desuccinylase [Thalassoglobus polymorphus]